MNNDEIEKINDMDLDHLGGFKLWNAYVDKKKTSPYKIKNDHLMRPPLKEYNGRNSHRPSHSEHINGTHHEQTRGSVKVKDYLIKSSPDKTTVI